MGRRKSSALSARHSELPQSTLIAKSRSSVGSQSIIAVCNRAPLTFAFATSRFTSLQCIAMGTTDIGPRRNFVRSVSRPPDQINLALSCLFIASENDPDLDVPLYMGRISEITERIRQKVRNRYSFFDTLYSLNELLFDELGYRGNVGKLLRHSQQSSSTKYLNENWVSQLPSQFSTWK